MSRISAIVSAYYAEPYLAGRIENLLEQKPKPEIIVVCQRDSKEHEISKGYDVVIVLTDDIPTIYKAWNMGIEKAKSEFITNANSDDRLYKGAFQSMIETFEKDKRIGVVYPDVDIVQEIDGAPVGRFTWNEGGLDELVKGCFIGPMPMWKAELHRKFGMFDETYHVAGDYEFWLRLASRGVKFRRYAEPLGAYTRRKKGAELREPLRTTWETARARSKYKGR